MCSRKLTKDLYVAFSAKHLQFNLNNLSTSEERKPLKILMVQF